VYTYGDLYASFTLYEFVGYAVFNRPATLFSVPVRCVGLRSPPPRCASPEPNMGMRITHPEVLDTK
jgi:hypothetical protein